MVLAAALISLAALATQADPRAASQAAAQAAPQAAPQAKPPVEREPAPADDSRPYTVKGVRRAADGNQPSVDYNPERVTPRGHRVAIDSRAVKPDPCSLVITACQPAWGGGANPTWHDQFIAMNGPPAYAVPYSGMSNSQTLQAVASSIAINLALQTVVSLIHNQIVKISSDRKQRKLENIRTGIRAELDELERLNAATRDTGQNPIR